MKEAFNKLESENKIACEVVSEQSEIQSKQFKEERTRKKSLEKSSNLINLVERSKKYLKRKGQQFEIMKNYCK